MLPGLLDKAYMPWETEASKYSHDADLPTTA